MRAGATVTTRAAEVVQRCRLLAGCSEEPGATTRTFLSAPMRDVHAHVTQWMTAAGMTVSVDAAGNIRGLYAAGVPTAPRLFIGSHLDTVPRAGAFDGVLGVVLAIALVDALRGRRLPFAIEVVGFSEEEGVRFGLPFIGSRALAGTLDGTALDRRDANGHSVADAIRAFGLAPSGVAEAVAVHNALGYLEFHIEQGPVLDGLSAPVGIVNAIVGQSRLAVTFTGAARHAGTTPMHARRDAVAAAAEWIGAVETVARRTPGLVATVGRLRVWPGAANVVAGVCEASLDVRHVLDGARLTAVETLRWIAHQIGARRELNVQFDTHLDQPSVTMNEFLIAALERAVGVQKLPIHRIDSGAGHDAMILARRVPAAMLFLRSPGGISHHPDETVVEDDVAAALGTGLAFLDDLAGRRG
jgi:allantoate deiminase